MAIVKNTPKELILRPYIKGLKSYLQFLVLGIIALGIFYLISDNREWHLIAASLVGFWALNSLYFVVVYYPMEIIFDKTDKIIYRKHSFLFKMKLLPFSNATLLLTQDNFRSQYYSIVHKENRFKPLQKISYYLSEKEKITFDKEILGEVGKVLEL
ncbi:hypothetical protein AB4865_11745 [Capnocytophaga sp. ARDL2]|uniref:hypothetical protein n=1 Tax=Capnocytophaga sp. ARDL2 TaxID=3238809 RepID=UPI0035566195